MQWRRLITIPGYLLLSGLWLAATPVWLPAAALVDLARRNGGVALRCSGMLTAYLCCEAAGILASGAIWLWNLLRPMSDEEWTDLHFRLEAWWGTSLFRAVVFCFALRLEVEGENEAAIHQGPYILLVRHSSSGDTLLASAIVSGPHQFRLRYVIKQEHLWDPCLDIVGNRVPNLFVDRSSANSAREVARVKDLARGLGPRDGILIYPEGTRFSEQKRKRVLAGLEQRGNTALAEYAASLSNVLPPRPGGTLGALEAAPDADVVLCCHTGFEGAASLAEIWKGRLIRRAIRVEFRRIPRSQIPPDPEGAADWLRDEWRNVDDWVGAHSEEAS